MSRDQSTTSNTTIANFYKRYNLTESKSFCMAPWIHLHSNPSGIAAPCCIAESGATIGVGNTRTQSLMEVVNSVKMNNLRKDMLTGVMNSECIKCHNHEKQRVLSSRNIPWTCQNLAISTGQQILVMIQPQMM